MNSPPTHPASLAPRSSPLPLLRTVTLGCKVNQYETEFVRQALAGIGFRDASRGETADLCIVNTCTVTHEGDSKSRQTIRQLAARNPGARIVVMGCYATRAPEEVAALPGVAEVITDKRELPDLLGRFGVVDLPTGISTFANRQRAYVKVQDGCLLNCTFCIIPKVRPHFSSRPIPHILDEINRLVETGYRELILTGIHLGPLRRRMESRPAEDRMDPTCRSRRKNRRTARRFPNSAIEHRSHRGNARIDRRDGGVSRKGLPAFARLAAKRLRCRAAADATALVLQANHRPLPAVPGIARSTGVDHRRNRRLSRRNRRRFRRHLPSGPRNRLFENPPISLQPPPRDTGR